MAEPREERPALVAAMLEPDFYPRPPPVVELRETHISWVFLAGELAYKVKKPLVLPFLDYGTVDRRREMCHEEVRLNRRLAPAIYLSVVGIARVGGRWDLTSADDPAALEYAVEMRRVEEARSLAALVARDELAAAHIDLVARLLARFHAEAPPAPSDRDAIEVLAATLDENAETLREASAGLLERRRVESAERFAGAFLAGRRAELEGRVRAGLVRDCHGDLRAEHVIVPADAPAYVYDCIEFNPSLREIDVAADISFLLMDLNSLGAAAAGARLIDAYRRAGGDPGGYALLSFFAAYRAWVRAKIACIRAASLSAEDPEREGCAQEAGRLLAVGHRFAWSARRPAVLVICGVSGSGKTTLARALAEVGGWPYLSSDLTRKRLAGLEPTERGGERLYSPEVTMRTYEELGRAARAAVEKTGSAIVDATFHRGAERTSFRAGLGGQPAPTLFVRCTAAPEVLRARVRGREHDSSRVSDADTAILDRQREESEPLLDVPDAARADLDTEAPPEQLVGEVEAFLDRIILHATTPAAAGGP
jgi:uncharacterized protein